MEVFDAHHHIGLLQHFSPGLAAKEGEKALSRDEMIDMDYRNRTRVMADNGIDRAVIMPTPGYVQPDGIKDTQKFNDMIAAYRAKDPKKFPVALGIVEPGHGERSLDEIDRIKHDLKLDGVMWHHRFHGQYIDAPIMKLFLKRMSRHGLVPVFHIYHGSLEAPWRLEVLAREFPEMTFLALDAFTDFEQCEEVFQIAKRTRNILFETALAFAPYWLIPRFMEDVGSDRTVFGSDLYTPPLSYDTCDILNHIRRAKIGDKDKENILGKNLKRLFKLP